MKSKPQVTETVEPTFEDLVAALKGHWWKSDCPECGESCSRVPLTKLAYTFEPCDCDAEPRFTRLVEQVHHKDCLTESRGKTLEEKPWPR